MKVSELRQWFEKTEGEGAVDLLLEMNTLHGLVKVTSKDPSGCTVESIMLNCEPDVYRGTLPPKPCPAGNCDAQLYSAGTLLWCPKCGCKNPNLKPIEYDIPAIQPVRQKPQQVQMDMESGRLKFD